MENQAKQTSAIKIDVALTKQNIIDLDDRVSVCESNTAYLLHYNELQRQTSLRNNISIMNIPSKSDEDLVGIISNICALLGHDIADGDLVSAHRVVRSRSKIIIAKFTNTDFRDALLKAKNNKKILAKDVINTSREDIVYINGHTLPHFNKILAHGRAYVRNGKIHSCWMANSGVCIRTDAEGKQVTVFSCSHMDEIVEKLSENTKSNASKRPTPDHISPSHQQTRPSKASKSNERNK